MQPLKKEDIQQSIDLYDQYAHNKLERRDFLAKLYRSMRSAQLPSVHY
jgi:hypothetical protein